MKLYTGLVAALAGCAAASQSTGEVYQIPGPKTSTTQSLLPSLARFVFLQRLSSADNGPSMHDVPGGISPEQAVSALSAYGKTVQPLFSDDTVNNDASQLLLILEDMTEGQMQTVGKTLRKPSFTLDSPPDMTSTGKMLELDFYKLGIAKEHECTIDEATNPLEEKCWTGKAAIAKYNAKDHPEAVNSLVKAVSRLQKLSKTHEMETIIVLLPEVQKSSKTNNWHDDVNLLRRGQAAEQVMSAFNDPSTDAAPTSAFIKDSRPFADAPVIQSCYESAESCIDNTGNCSSHGFCTDKYSNSEGKSGKNACWRCECRSTNSTKEGITHWGGITCAKKDVSVPFWLFAGFTVGMIGIVSMAVSMLFSVGEEKLPGVIGAGVSKSK